MSIRRMLDVLQDAQQVVAVFPAEKNKVVTKVSYSRLEGVAKEYADKYNLLKYVI